MYEDPDNGVIYQGDIVRKFLFSSIDQPLENELSGDDIPEGYSRVPRLDYRQAIVVTQTCDITRRKFILLAPVFPLQTFIDVHRDAGKKEANISGEVSQLKNQKIFYYFYVPPDETRGVIEGYADLTFLNPLESEKRLSLDRIAKISDHQRHILGHKLGNLFSRPH